MIPKINQTMRKDGQAWRKAHPLCLYNTPAYKRYFETKFAKKYLEFDRELFYTDSEKKFLTFVADMRKQKLL